MRERGENGDMTDERGTTEPGGTAATQAAEEARKLKARELNELIRYTMWSVFRVADRAGLDAGGREAAAGPSAGRDRVLVPRPRDRSRSPEPSQIKGENIPLASRTPLRRGDARPLCQGPRPVIVLTRMRGSWSLPHKGLDLD